MVIITWFLFKSEEKKVGKSDFIAALAVSSIVISILAFIGTLVQDSNNIPMIQTDILLYFIAVTIVLILLWIFKED